MPTAFRDYCAQSPCKINCLQPNSLHSGTGNFQTCCREIFWGGTGKFSLQGTGAAVQLSVGRAEDDFHCLAATPRIVDPITAQAMSDFGGRGDITNWSRHVSF